MTRSALLLGGSGLVGRQLLNELLNSPEYHHVTLLLRQSIVLQHAKLQQQILDFEQLEQYSLNKVDDVFCSLGTTLKAAGSQAAFYRVDFTYVEQLARQALAQGAQQFLLVSSTGANARSPFFYMRVKGEIENAIRALNYPSAAVFRPAYLSGTRPQSRPIEQCYGQIMQALSPCMPRQYRPIAASTVARAMLAQAARQQSGFHIIESGAMQAHA